MSIPNLVSVYPTDSIMMTDSPHRRSSGVFGSMKQVGAMIRPQPVTEKSLMESVAGFINEVQAYNQPMQDSKVQVTWARFETTDINDVGLYPDNVELSGNSPPLLLVLGYTQGVQVWLIPPTGEAQEVLSWKQGQVKTLRILPTPEDVFGYPDNFAHVRPLIVMSDSTGPGTAFSSASFMSLKSGEQVHNIKFNSEIADITVNRRVVAMSFKEKLAVFDACTLDARFTITSCYPSPGVHANPIALGERWLAYADQKLIPIHRSFGGMETDGNQTVAAWGINVGAKLAQGVSKIYSNIFAGSPRPAPTPATCTNTNEPQKGVVTILDILQVQKGEREEVNISDKIDGVVAHFIAHNKAIVAMEFDHSGSLLLTCDSVGNRFHLFRVVPHPAGACYTAIHHLYSLYRGDTPGSVQDIAFSPDSRWVAVSTLRGTTHIFPITPYGGPVGVRTHTSPRVVNRLSRFHRSAGIDDFYPAVSGGANTSGRNSPNPTLGTSPSGSSVGRGGSSFDSFAQPLIIPYPNPHVPPFPLPTVIQPVAQLRQPYIVTLTNQTLGTGASMTRGKQGRSASQEDIPIRLAVTFAPSRAWLVGTQHNMFTRQQKKMNDALYVMANHGVLLEYSLDPVPDSTLPKEKICESSPIELQVSAYGQWSLTKPRDRAELQPPLPIDNPLMVPLDQVGPTKSSFASHEQDDEEKWLSQVEIITHVGPHRRLWMGPQFSFKTMQPAGSSSDSSEAQPLDVNVAIRPKQSNPVNISSGLSHHRPQGSVPVLIEACSASSFELSPRFSNHFSNRLQHLHGSKELVHQDVESELIEAMSETVLANEDSLLDGVPTSISSSSGGRSTKKRLRGESSTSIEEEFFCLTPDDTRSIASSGRSRNASATDPKSEAHRLPVQMNTTETKIFSVAVEAKKANEGQTGDAMKVCDVEAAFTGMFAAVVSDKKKVPEVAKEDEKKVEEKKVEPQQQSSTGKSKKNKKKKNKPGDSGNITASSNDEEASEKAVEKKLPPVQTKAFVRDTSPLFVEEKADDIQRELDLLVAEAECSVTVAGNDPDLVAVTEEEPVFTELQKSSEDPSDEEFVIREKSSSADPDDEDLIGGGDNPHNDSFEDPKVAKPEALPTWVDDFFKQDNPIVKKIEEANKIYAESEGNDEEQDKSLFNHLLKLDSEKSKPRRETTDSSEDDFDFQPTVNRRQKKKGVSMTKSNELDYRGSYADSESSSVHDEPMKPPAEGWSFEADDLDVNKLISDVVKEKEEKTSLEDVFKFDSELPSKDSFSRSVKLHAATSEAKVPVQKSLSLDDLNDALADDLEPLKKAEDEKVMSQSLGSTSDTSSVGNSPNVKKTKSKSKKKKKNR